jgi:hypothetical protein
LMDSRGREVGGTEVGFKPTPELAADAGATRHAIDIIVRARPSMRKV